MITNITVTDDNAFCETQAVEQEWNPVEPLEVRLSLQCQCTPQKGCGDGWCWGASKWIFFLSRISMTLDMNAAFWISQPLLPIYVSGKAPATNASAFVSTIGASSVQLRIWRLFGIQFATFMTFGDLTASALMLGTFPLTVKHDGSSNMFLCVQE